MKFVKKINHRNVAAAILLQTCASVLTINGSQQSWDPFLVFAQLPHRTDLEWTREWFKQYGKDINIPQYYTSYSPYVASSYGIPSVSPTSAAAAAEALATLSSAKTSEPMNIDQTDQADAVPASASSSSAASSSGLSFDGIAQQPPESAESRQKRVAFTAKRTNMRSFSSPARAVAQARIKQSPIEMDVEEEGSKAVSPGKRKRTSEDLQDETWTGDRDEKKQKKECFEPTEEIIKGLGEAVSLTCKEPGCNYATDAVAPTSAQLERAFDEYANHIKENHKTKCQTFSCTSAKCITVKKTDSRYVTNRREKLIDHLRACYATKPFKCEHCSYRANLFAHVANHMQKKECVVEENDQTEYYSPSNDIIAGLGNEQVLNCEKSEQGCPFKITNIAPTAESLEPRFKEYLEHLTTSHKETWQKFACPKCKQQLDRDGKFLDHLRTCYQTKPFLCPNCSTRRNRVYEIESHLEMCQQT